MQIGPVTENRVARLNDETGYQSNRIFCHTNHFSSYKLEEAVGQDAFTDTSMSFPGSAPGKRLKNLHANTHLEHLIGKLSRKKKVSDRLRLIFGI